jgi:hypothetical protein
MGFAGKAIHHRADFGHHNGANALIDPGHLIEDADHLSTAQSRGAGSRDSRRRQRLSQLSSYWPFLGLGGAGLAFRGVRSVWAAGYSQSLGYLLIQLCQLRVKNV